MGQVITPAELVLQQLDHFHIAEASLHNTALQTSQEKKQVNLKLPQKKSQCLFLTAQSNP